MEQIKSKDGGARVVVCREGIGSYLSSKKRKIGEKSEKKIEELTKRRERYSSTCRALASSTPSEAAATIFWDELLGVNVAFTLQYRTGIHVFFL